MASTTHGIHQHLSVLIFLIGSLLDKRQCVSLSSNTSFHKCFKISNVYVRVGQLAVLFFFPVFAGIDQWQDGESCNVHLCKSAGAPARVKTSWSSKTPSKRLTMWFEKGKQSVAASNWPVRENVAHQLNWSHIKLTGLEFPLVVWGGWCLFVCSRILNLIVFHAPTFLSCRRRLSNDWTQSAPKLSPSSLKR